MYPTLTLFKVVFSYFNATQRPCFPVFYGFLKRFNWNGILLVGYGFFNVFNAFESIPF